MTLIIAVTGKTIGLVDDSSGKGETGAGSPLSTRQTLLSTIYNYNDFSRNDFNGTVEYSPGIQQVTICQSRTDARWPARHSVGNAGDGPSSWITFLAGWLLFFYFFHEDGAERSFAVDLAFTRETDVKSLVPTHQSSC